MRTVQKLAWGGVAAGATYFVWSKLQEHQEAQSYAGLTRSKTFLILGAGFGGTAVA